MKEKLTLKAGAKGARRHVKMRAFAFIGERFRSVADAGMLHAGNATREAQRATGGGLLDVAKVEQGFRFYALVIHVNLATADVMWSRRTGRNGTPCTHGGSCTVSLYQRFEPRMERFSAGDVHSNTAMSRAQRWSVRPFSRTAMSIST